MYIYTGYTCGGSNIPQDRAEVKCVRQMVKNVTMYAMYTLQSSRTRVMKHCVHQRWGRIKILPARAKSLPALQSVKKKLQTKYYRSSTNQSASRDFACVRDFHSSQL